MPYLLIWTVYCSHIGSYLPLKSYPYWNKAQASPRLFFIVFSFAQKTPAICCVGLPLRRHTKKPPQPTEPSHTYWWVRTEFTLNQTAEESPYASYNYWLSPFRHPSERSRKWRITLKRWNEAGKLYLNYKAWVKSLSSLRIAQVAATYILGIALRATLLLRSPIHIQWAQGAD